jgi:hypothetical protein
MLGVVSFLIEKIVGGTATWITGLHFINSIDIEVSMINENPNPKFKF